MKEKTTCPKCGSKNATLDDDTGAEDIYILKCSDCGHEQELGGY